MTKLKMQTPDLTAQNIEKIAELFPNCITEMVDENGQPKRAVNFPMLKQMLSGEVLDGDEAYEFTWVGKKASIVEANRPIRKTLRPFRSESRNWDSTENLYIEGDNLEVLKLLQESYLGKVKMIYIDPPYNTGNDFIYRDDFRQSAAEYDEESGVFDEDENRLFKNTDSNGRFHSDWCSMIYPRLLLARNLLSDDGVIFISIDDNEVAQMRKICDEVFGEENFIDCLIWKKRYGGGAKEKYLVTLHEYVLFYSKNIYNIKEIFVPLSEKSIEQYYSKKDEKYEIRGGYRIHPLEAGKAMDSRPNLVYGITAPDGTIVMPKKQWLWAKERVDLAIKNNEIEFSKSNNGSWVISSKQYLKDENGEMRLGKTFSIIDDIYTQHGTNEMIKIMGNAKIFNYPKPIEFLKKLLLVGSYKDSIILDFFSGSATTAHAVMQLNAEDGGNRKFIMVQLPEPCDEKSEAYKAGYKNICEIGKERIRRAGDKIKAETGADIDYGFRVFKVDDSNMNDIYYSVAELSQTTLASTLDNIKPDRSALDLLFGCLLDWGLPLSMPYKSEQLGGCTVHTYNEGDLLACFDMDIPEEVLVELAKRQPLRAVFRDSCFADSPAKINVFEIFKLYAPDCTVKVL